MGNKEDEYEVSSDASEETRSATTYDTRSDEKSDDICRDHLADKCKWGKKGRFQHIDRDDHVEAQKKRGACRWHFNGGKGCFAGIACDYSHDEEWLSKQKAKNKSRVCRNFVKTGKCIKGNACFYEHEAKHATVYKLFKDHPSIGVKR